MKVAYLAKMANLQLATNMANFRQCRDKIFNEMAKRPFESGDFDENGDVDQNSEKSPKPLPASQMKRQRVPPKKVVNMAKMARNGNGDFEGDGKFAENG